MRAIWKFRVGEEGPIVMPENPQFLRVAMQGDTLYLWALVDPSAERRQRRIVMLGTGFERTEAEMASLTYIGTVDDVPFVWHIFDGGPV